MVPEEADDLWVAYNLIAEGDTVLAVTVRYVYKFETRLNFLNPMSYFSESHAVKVRLCYSLETLGKDWNFESAIQEF